MDIVIAAAGKGTRLKDLTTDVPKHILPIAGRPFLYYLLDAINAANFRRAIIVGGYHYEQLTQALEKYVAPIGSTEILVVNQFAQLGETKYGTACPLLAAEALLQGDRFVYTMGDQLISPADFERMHLSTTEMLVATYQHDEPERFGVVVSDEQHHLKQIIEKPATAPSNQVNVGLYTLTREIFPALRNLKTSSRNEYEIVDALNALAITQPIRVLPLQDYWLDLGRPEDIKALEQFIQHAQ